VDTEPVATADEAESVAVRLGLPVVIKGMRDDVHHKSELGLVAVGLTSVQQVRDTFADMAERVGRDGAVVVQPMARAGLELIIGVHRDPTFGPVMLVGLGGTLVEVLEDRRLAVPPVSRAGAVDLLRGLRAAPLFDGFRGSPRVDLPAAARVIAQLSELACDLGDVVASVDLNPVIVGPEGDGAVVVDWVIEGVPD
jgi:hypothetical protein